MPKVPKLKPDLSETEQIVVSVLESFHETSEPDFFKEYRDPPYTKLVDPYSDDRSDREVDDDGGNEAPLLAEGNRRLEKVLKQLSDVKRRTVVALMFLGAAESQVAGERSIVLELTLFQRCFPDQSVNCW